VAAVYRRGDVLHKRSPAPRGLREVLRAPALVGKVVPMRAPATAAIWRKSPMGIGDLC
jgi:hypothetical protein